MNKNLALRLSVAAIGIPALLLIALSGSYLLLAFCLLLAGLGGFELAHMAKNKDIVFNPFLSVIMPMACVAAAFWDIPLIHVLVIGLIVISLALVLRGKTEHFLNHFAMLALPLFYLGILAAFIIYLGKLPQAGNHLLILAFLIVWAVDTAAYFGGKAFGKKKLSPAISPNKTWAGFYFGFAGALAAAIASKMTFLDIGLSRIIILAFAGCLFAQLGDLFESAIKRYFAVKDSSTILPGHGGILDRFDSLLFAAPVIYLIQMFWK